MVGSPMAGPAGALRTSELLRELASRRQDSLSIAEVVRGLRSRASGVLLVCFGAPCMLPLPPPLPLLSAIGIALVAVSMLASRRSVWLPASLSRRRFSRGRLNPLFERLVPHVARIERLCRPRLLMLTDRPARVLIGVVVLLLALVLMLPIPLGNLPPGFAVTVTGVGLSERDGLVASAGLLLSVAALAFTSAAAHGAVSAVAVAL